MIKKYCCNETGGLVDILKVNYQKTAIKILKVIANNEKLFSLLVLILKVFFTL